MKTKYKCLYEITGCIEDVATFLVPIADLSKQEQGEPVAFKDVHKAWADYMDAHRDDFPDRWVIFHAGWRSAEKYTTPQQRKPLTDEQMNALWFDTNKQHGSVIWRFARAIEAAHGITPQGSDK